MRYYLPLFINARKYTLHVTRSEFQLFYGNLVSYKGAGPDGISPAAVSVLSPAGAYALLPTALLPPPTITHVKCSCYPLLNQMTYRDGELVVDETLQIATRREVATDVPKSAHFTPSYLLTSHTYLNSPICLCELPILVGLHASHIKGNRPFGQDGSPKKSPA